MSHVTARGSYEKLVDRINKMPQGAPPSQTLYSILKMLFSEKEAELVAQLPIRPVTVKGAAKRWSMPEEEAQKVLTGLASRAVLIDIETDMGMRYVLPPPMAGFFEFSMMRLRGDVDQKVLGQLYYQYLNQEEDFVKQLFTGTETNMIRAYVNESVLSSEQMVEILDFEKASYYIETQEHMGISMCYCRHKMSHTEQGACDAPMDICMTFGAVGDSLIRNGYARRVDKVEGMELLHQAYENNLVQCGENVKKGIGYICNCCGCCCEALLAVKRFGNLHPVETTNFIAHINDKCVNCGKCVSRCPVDAIEKQGDKTVVLEDVCLGCGICVRSCNIDALDLNQREKRIITPDSSVHRTVLMAIEKGQLQNLVFDNDALYSHRAMAAILSSILKLSPVKKAMASEQFRSVYLQKLIKAFK
ncbi:MULTISPECIES: 4Fe-4S dicluster-binding protein [unclassified Fusibacter]|uniref:4Fe-4S dicluster-binding protein n=1 Tax=unclassified Fusibacter TaxID=2624464 RepID=UPI0010121668|nr:MULTISPECIES: 4Fe-4S dicluster-binding protein [unclassified Fusibacter]MCK8060138.1 4Fe-4S binding protein [Fusibacter sp. A2]NPE22280.1 4Fe-4S binding protein [Fusibacter sp. A1]RXV61053.1 (Fe-S)-binding protein [Fusibacter sp. A1]